MESNRDRWSRVIRLVVTLVAIGLPLLVGGIALPTWVAWESPTSMPYSWPAHHRLYLHTAWEAASCTVDDGVTERFTVVIRQHDRSLRAAGQQVAALDSGPATVTCDAPVTADLDPDLRYTLAAGWTPDMLALAGAAMVLLAVHLVFRTGIVQWARG